MNHVPLWFASGFGDASTTDPPRLQMLRRYANGRTIGQALYTAGRSFDNNFNAMVNNIGPMLGNLATSTIFIGESAGGFYAARLAAHFGARCVLINPLTNPGIEPFRRLLEGNATVLSSYINAYNDNDRDPRPRISNKVALFSSHLDDTIMPDDSQAYFQNQLHFYTLMFDYHAISGPNSAAHIMGVVDRWCENPVSLFPVYPLYINHLHQFTAIANGTIDAYSHARQSRNQVMTLFNYTRGTQISCTVSGNGNPGHLRLAFSTGDVGRLVFDNASDWRNTCVGLHSA